MKKVLFLILLLVLIFVSFLNLNENLRKEESVVPVKEPPNNTAEEEERIEEELPPDLFPDVYDLSRLKIDPKLPFLKFKNLKDTVEVETPLISIEVIVPPTAKHVDLFLFKNKRKTDMYYQISNGIFKFNNVRLTEGENTIETFYRKNQKRSISVYTTIKLIKKEDDG